MEKGRDGGMRRKEQGTETRSETVGQSGTQTVEQTNNKHADRQTGRQTDRQTARKTKKQTCIVGSPFIMSRTSNPKRPAVSLPDSIRSCGGNDQGGSQSCPCIHTAHSSTTTCH